jgi:CRP-like cAMP-binding protein
VLPGAVILHFSFDRLVNAEGKHPELRARLLKNLTAELADKFFEQQERINCLIRPSLREKITMFLKNESKRKKSTVFNIPMNRERLAIYLNTNRSALSRELSRMKRAGVIDYYKNSFNLKKDVEYYDNQTHEKEREA